MKNVTINLERFFDSIIIHEGASNALPEKIKSAMQKALKDLDKPESKKTTAKSKLPQMTKGQQIAADIEKHFMAFHNTLIEATSMGFKVRIHNINYSAGPDTRPEIEVMQPVIFFKEAEEFPDTLTGCKED